jgi:hypothetical protein
MAVAVDKHFLVQVKRTNGNFEKGCVVKDSLDAALQSYFAYLSAYGYGHDVNTDYVMVGILNSKGLQLEGRVWEKPEENEEVEE